MQFSKLVKKKNVFSDLASPEREGLLREMVTKLRENEELTEADVEPVYEALLERERLGSTGIGKGVAIPHIRYEGVDHVVVGVGRSANGLDFSAVDGEPVKVVFLIIAPPAKNDEYLSALRWVTMAARDDYNNKLLQGARTPTEFVELFRDIEETM